MELPPLNRIEGVHRGSSLYHINDGFYFVRTRQRHETYYFRCSKSGSGCPATGILNLGHFQSSLVHNHPPYPVQVILERQRLINEAANLDYATLGEVFTNSRNLFPDLLTQHSLQPAMTRRRDHALPLEPSTLRELDPILSNDNYKCLCATSYFKDSVYTGSIESEDGCFVVLLLSRDCKEFMKHAITLFTFTTPFTMLGAPHPFWVHVIYTVWDGTFIILAWFLMERISDQGFTAALSLLRSALVIRHFKYVVCQLGSIEATTYRSVFAPVHVTFCLQDFVHNLTNCVKSVNTRHANLVDIASLVCALPILPTDFLHLGLICIQEEIRRYEGIAEQANTLLAYVQSHWLNVVNDFSVSGDFYRTSNVNEIVQRRVLRIIDSHKNSIYGLIRDIASVAEVSGRDILELRRGRKVQYRRAWSVSDEKDTEVLTRALVHPHCKNSGVNFTLTYWVNLPLWSALTTLPIQWIGKVALATLKNKSTNP